MEAGQKSPARLVQNILLLLLLAGVVYYFARDFSERQKGIDFTDRYAAARMVLEGYGHELYDFRAQEQFQIRYAGRIGEYYVHPPLGTLLYLPVCLWSPRMAYLIWTILNAGVLAYIAILFQRDIFKRFDWRVLLPLLLLFPPVLISFFQGQDSLELLLFMTLAVVELQRGRDFRAGCWLACGLFKFHIVLIFLALIVSFGRKRVLGGFGLVSLILLLVSAAISGWDFLRQYARFLMNPVTSPSPGAMPNIRGLITVSEILRNPLARFILICVVSSFVLWWAWKSFTIRKTEDFEGTNLAIGNFVLAAILVSYHLSTCDLCIALLPVALFSQYMKNHTGIRRWARLTLMGTQLVFLLPPLHVLLLAHHDYVYLIIPILIMFTLTSANIFKGGAAEPAGVAAA